MTKEEIDAVNEIVNKSVEFVDEDENAASDDSDSSGKAEAEEEYHCPECGAKITLDMTKCPKCGCEFEFEEGEE